MGFGTVLWNVTEYLTYVAIIIQTGFLLLGWLGFGSPGGSNGQPIESYLERALGMLGSALNKANNEDAAPAKVRRR